MKWGICSKGLSQESKSEECESSIVRMRGMFDIWNEPSVITESQYEKANYRIENKRGGTAIYFAPRIIYGFLMKKYTLKKW